jgi:uncharacterized RDD family membrane protein YckC
MNTITRPALVGFALAALSLIAPLAFAQDAPAAKPQIERPQVERPQVQVEAPAATPAADAKGDEPEMTWDRAPNRRGARHGGSSSSHGDERVSFGNNATLNAGEHADSVVSIFGSSTSSGEVSDAVVSVLGSTRIEGGSVGDAAVAVIGDNYVNAKIDGDVVAVLGNAELGPNADIRGSVTVVGGTLKRDPRAQVGGSVQHVMTLPSGALTGLRSWLENCVRYLRPLAFAQGLGWAWTIALGFLGLYVLLGAMFREPMDRCVKTLQDHPGQTILASLLAMILTPVFFTVLCITVIGIVFVPIAAFGIFLVTLFGKAVVLAWIGRSVLRFIEDSEKLNAGLAVLAGGAIALLLYTVPVLGFIIYNLLGILAFGVVVYTLLLALRARRKTSPPPGGVPGGTRGPSGPGVDARGPAYGAGGVGGAAYATGGPAFAAGATGASNPYDATSSVASVASDTGATGAADASGAGIGADAQAGAAGPQGYGPSVAGGAYGSPPGAQPPVNEALTQPRAGFWIRMVALLIDVVLISIALTLLSHTSKLFLISLATYGAIMWKVKGTTVGGIVCNLKVVRVDGRPMDWPTSVIRALGCFLSLIVVGLGFIWIAFDEGRQSWHDKIAGTAVVRSPQGVSLL